MNDLFLPLHTMLPVHSRKPKFRISSTLQPLKNKCTDAYFIDMFLDIAVGNSLNPGPHEFI